MGNLTNAPRVLFLTCHLPFPPVSGGRRREFELIRRISETVDVHVCCVSKTIDEDLRNAVQLAPYCSDVEVFPADEDMEAPLEQSSLPFQVLRHRSSALSERVAQLLETGRFDLIHVEAFYMMQHVPPAPGAPVLLVEQNVEYALWRQRTRCASDPPERKRNLREYLKTLEAEIGAWRRSDLCAAVTEEDRVIMSSALGTPGVRLVPDGCDHLTRSDRPDPLVARIRGVGPAVVFVGNFGYEPNFDAAMFLLADIWPRIAARHPSARLWFVGNDPPQALAQVADDDPRIVVTGRVEAVEPFLSAADVVVCPLRIGGGIKVKVIEALHAGVPVVSTSIGVQGVGPGVEDAVLVRDDPITFADAVARLLQRPDERARLSANALGLAARLPTWDEAAQALRSCYEDLVRSQSSLGRGLEDRPGTHADRARA